MIAELIAIVKLWSLRSMERGARLGQTVAGRLKLQNGHGVTSIRDNEVTKFARRSTVLGEPTALAPDRTRLELNLVGASPIIEGTTEEIGSGLRDLAPAISPVGTATFNAFRGESKPLFRRSSIARVLDEGFVHDGT